MKFIQNIIAAIKEAIDNMRKKKIGNRYPAGITVASLSASAVNADEGTTVSINITWTSSAIAGTVRFYTVPLTASSSDFQSYNEEITLAPGGGSITKTVTITDDILAEADETFKIQIANPRMATIGTGVCVVTINGEELPIVTVASVTNASANEGDAIVHTVTMTSNGGGVFPFSITNGTASSGDYTLPPTFNNGVTLSGNNITVPNGVSSFTLSISTVENTLLEANETYTISVGGVTATGTINNDDAITVVSVTSPTVEEGETIVWTVTLSQASNGLTYSLTLGGTATTGVDYNLPLVFSNAVTLSGSTITVPSGVTSFTVSTLTDDDIAVEANETVILTVGGVSGTATITDDDVEVVTVSSVSSPTVSEGNNLVFTVLLSGTTSSIQSFPFSVGGTAIAGTDFATPLVFNNGVTISGGNLIVPALRTGFTATTLTSSDALTESTETVILTVGGVTGTGSITDVLPPEELIPLTDIVVYEAPYGKLSSPQQANVFSSPGGYPAFAVSRGVNTTSPNFNIYKSTTLGGTYTLVASNQTYATSARVVDALTYNHETLSVDSVSEFPSSIAPGAYGLLTDSAGQVENLILDNVALVTIEGETSRQLTNIGVAAYDSVPIAVNQDEIARLWVIPAPVILNDLIGDGVTTYWKVAPNDASGTPLSLAGITPIALTIQSNARRPYPPRDNRLGGFSNTLLNFPYRRLEFTGTFYLNMYKSSRVDEGATPSSYFKPGAARESDVEFKVDILDADGAVLIRTLTADSNGLATYSTSDRAADIARTNTRYRFYSEKSGIKSKSWDWVIEQNVQYENVVTAVGVAQEAGDLMQAAIILKADEGAPQGSGQETFLVFIKLTGTLAPHVDMSAIYIEGAQAEIIDVDIDAREFWVQGTRNKTDFLARFPFNEAGSSGKTLTVGAGRRNLSIGADELILDSANV